MSLNLSERQQQVLQCVKDAKAENKRPYTAGVVNRMQKKGHEITEKQVSDYELVLPETRSASVDYLVRSMFILAHVYKHAPVTSHDIQGIFSGVCLRTVQRILKTLVGLGYLNGIKGEGVSNQITYEVNEQYVPWVAEYVKTLPTRTR